VAKLAKLIGRMRKRGEAPAEQAPEATDGELSALEPKKPE
jgi:hypothetical protein